MALLRRTTQLMIAALCAASMTTALDFKTIATKTENFFDEVNYRVQLNKAETIADVDAVETSLLNRALLRTPEEQQYRAQNEDLDLFNRLMSDISLKRAALKQTSDSSHLYRSIGFGSDDEGYRSTFTNHHENGSSFGGHKNISHIAVEHNEHNVSHHAQSSSNPPSVVHNETVPHRPAGARAPRRPVNNRHKGARANHSPAQDAEDAYFRSILPSNFITEFISGRAKQLVDKFGKVDEAFLNTLLTMMNMGDLSALLDPTSPGPAADKAKRNIKNDPKFRDFLIRQINEVAADNNDDVMYRDSEVSTFGAPPSPVKETPFAVGFDNNQTQPIPPTNVTTATTNVTQPAVIANPATDVVVNNVTNSSAASAPLVAAPSVEEPQIPTVQPTTPTPPMPTPAVLPMKPKPAVMAKPAKPSKPSGGGDLASSLFSSLTSLSGLSGLTSLSSLSQLGTLASLATAMPANGIAGVFDTFGIPVRPSCLEVLIKHGSALFGGSSGGVSALLAGKSSDLVQLATMGADVMSACDKEIAALTGMMSGAGAGSVPKPPSKPAALQAAPATGVAPPTPIAPGSNTPASLPVLEAQVKTDTQSGKNFSSLVNSTEYHWGTKQPNASSPMDGTYKDDNYRSWFGHPIKHLVQHHTGRKHHNKRSPVLQHPTIVSLANNVVGPDGKINYQELARIAKDLAAKGTNNVMQALEDALDIKVQREPNGNVLVTQDDSDVGHNKFTGNNKKDDSSSSSDSSDSSDKSEAWMPNYNPPAQHQPVVIPASSISGGAAPPPPPPAARPNLPPGGLAPPLPPVSTEGGGLRPGQPDVDEEEENPVSFGTNTGIVPPHIQHQQQQHQQQQPPQQQRPQQQQQRPQPVPVPNTNNNNVVKPQSTAALSASQPARRPATNRT